MSDPAVEAAQRASYAVGYDQISLVAIDAAREALKPIRELIAEARTWKGYQTRDIGHVFLADTVIDLLDELEKLT